MRKAVLCLFLLALMFSSHGEVIAGVSDAAVLFLRIAAGARAAGMGEAFVAIADDATATHWNPAGLGSYPLASQFHEIRISDDKPTRDLAREVLKGELDEDFSSTNGQLIFTSDDIVRILDSGEEERSVEFEVDLNITAAQFIAASATLDDRDLLKEGVRAIASENTNVTFEQINGHRIKLLDYLNDDQTSEVNRLFESLVADWQNLRIVPESITFLEERLNFVLSDQQLSTDEYGQVIETLTNASRKTRPRTIRVPYKVLLALWKDYSLPWQTKILDMVLLENDVPEENFKQYDIWALTPSGIVRRDENGIWKKSLDVFPKKSDQLKGLISAYAGVVDEDELLAYSREVAATNYGVGANRVEEIVGAIRAAYTGDAVPSEAFSYDLDHLIERFGNMNLKPERFQAFLDAYGITSADGDLTPEDLDRLEFALKSATAERLPLVVQLPLALPFPTEPTCIATTEKLLWVGSDDGLFVFNGRAWQKYSAEDNLPSSKINALSVYEKNRLWIATGKGVAHYYKGSWVVHSLEAGLEEIEFTQVYGYSRDKAWAAAENRLFFFNGSEWRSDYRRTVAINDTVNRIVREFTGIHDKDYISQVAEEIKTKNGLTSDFPEAGSEVLIPFEYAFRHPITSMVFDDDKGNLWVGTTHGLKILADGRFKVFGYKLYTAPRDMSVEEAAQDFDEEAGSGKVTQLAALIKSYNYIDGDRLRAGQVVYVYSNPLGSYIYTMCKDGGRILVGTNFGTVKYSGDRFGRYYHNNLEREKTVKVIASGGDLWLATPQKVVIYAHAKKEITLMHAKWLPQLTDDLYFEFISYVQHLGDEWGTLGLNAAFLSYGESTRMTPQGDTAGTFTSFDGALAISYGATVSPELSVGVSAKVIHSRLSDQGAGAELGRGNATAFAVDAGLLYRTPIRGLTFGAAITNLGPNVAYIDAAQSDPLPRNLAVGLAYDLFRNPYNRLTLVGEINKMLTDLDDGLSEEMKEAIENVGFEYWYGSFVALRGGYIYDQVGEISTFTVGAGLQYKQMRFDFAYIPSSETLPLANTLRISLTGRL